MTKEQNKENSPKVEKTYPGYTSQADSESLPPIVPVEIQGETFWVHLDTGSGRDFIPSDAVKKRGLQPIRYETRHILTVNGTKRQSLPVYSTLKDNHYLCIASLSSFLMGKQKRNLKLQVLRILIFQQCKGLKCMNSN